MFKVTTSNNQFANIVQSTDLLSELEIMETVGRASYNNIDTDSDQEIFYDAVSEIVDETISVQVLISS